MFTDFPPIENCLNPDSFGEICIRCGKCGRTYPSIALDTKIIKIMEECDYTENIAKTVCKHVQYCGNQLLANGEVDRFICRKYLLEYKRNDEMGIIKPYTESELIESLKKFCQSHFDDCEEIEFERVKPNEH